MADQPTDDAGESGLSVVAGGAVRVFGGRVAKLLLVFATQIAMARALDTAEYGGVVIAQMAIGVGSIVAALGLETGLARQIPLYETAAEKTRGVVRAGLAIGLLSGASVGALVFLTAPTVATRLFDDPSVTPLLQLAALAIPFGVVSHVAAAVARGAGSTAVRVVVRQLLNPAVNLLLVVGVLLAGYGAAGATAGVVASIVVGTAIALWLALRALPISLRGPTVPMGWELVVFSLPLLLASSVEFLISNTDTFLVGVYLGSGAVGVYDVAFRLRQFGLFFFFPVTFLLPTVLTRLDRDDERAALRRTYQVATKWLVLLSTPPVLLFFLFPGVAIEAAFGAAYRGGAPALRVLLVPVMVTVLLSANGAALVALGHNRINAVVNGGTAVLNVALNVALIPPFGIVGAALASAASFVARDVAYTVVLYRREGVQPFSAALLRPLAASLALAAGGYLVFLRLVTPTVLSVAVAGVAYLVVYAPLVVVLGAIEPEDERLLDRLEGQVDVDLAPLRAGLRRLRRVG